ncbi:MAG TPA: pyridoxal-phosphate dependent enzyme [Candidatus Eisenbacteria bacterium]|nr:pyridoxal-phosphate dependent enzyme [Candidatus Eisenbacteria bacterium]
MSDHSKRVYDSIVELLSSVENPTPLVKIRRLSPYRHTTVYAKLEWYNPFGAVKDRIAAQLLHDAEARGVKLEHLVEPTSGNTGMALAMLANARELDFTATLSMAIPEEKRAALRAFGAKLVELSDDLCPMPGAPEGAMEKANELAQQPGWHQLNQYKNPANPEAHFRTTGPEIWRQTEGKITHFVAGLGTCGTITGTGRFLKSQNPAVKVLGVHPSEGHDIPGVRSRRALKLTDFFLPQEYDGVLEIGNDEAYQMCKRLNQEESLIAGPSSGMALSGAFEMVPDEPGALCVVMFPDSVFKYISSLRKHLPELFPAAAAQPAATPEPSVDEVTPAEAIQMIRAGAALVDVRTPAEFIEGHVEDSVNIPVQSLEAGPVQGLPADKHAPIVTVCATGRRSLAAVQALKAQGFTNVSSVRGGLRDWAAEVARR